MSEPSPAMPAEPLPAPPDRKTGWVGRWLRDALTLRKESPLWESVLWGIACLLVCFCGWWLLTLGTAEERIIGPLTLPSPRETFDPRQDLWPPREATDPDRSPTENKVEWKRNLPRFIEERQGLALNTLVTLRRVAMGFLLAVAIGVPVGVLAGCFPRFNSFLVPVVIFGRNIPLAAVLPLLLYIFQQGERRKIMFIFIACVAFVIADTAQAIRDVADRYVDTAYTLGASRWQTIVKVLVPLAMPAIFSSFRVMFGLAFGYIMLAESIKDPDDVGGLGFQINAFQRRGPREYIYLIILIIPLVALAVDQVMFWVQRQLFPYVFGGPGWLQRGVRVALHGWDDLKRFFFRYDPPAIATAVPPPAAGLAPPEAKTS